MTTTLDVAATSIDDLDDLEERELQEPGTTLPGALTDLVALLAQSYAVDPALRLTPLMARLRAIPAPWPGGG